MNKYVIFLLLGFCLGCDQGNRPAPPPPPKPTIEVELTESSGGASVNVRFVNHIREGQYGWSHVVFDNLDELHDYQKQADFLVQQLDDAEKKMQNHEQGTQQ